MPSGPLPKVWRRFSGRNLASKRSLATSTPTQGSEEAAGLASMTELLSCRCELEAGWCLVRLWRLFGLTVPDRRRSGSVTVWEHLGTIDLPPAASRIAAPLRFAAIREADFTTFRPDLLFFWNIQDTEDTEIRSLPIVSVLLTLDFFARREGF